MILHNAYKKDKSGNILLMHNNFTELEKAMHIVQLSAMLNNDQHKLDTPSMQNFASAWDRARDWGHV